MQLRSEITIFAPKDIVWSVLTDIERYHEWNPFITSFTGKLVAGESLSIVVSPPDSSDFRFTPVLLAFEEGKEIRWKGKLLTDFLFAGEHYLQVRDVGNGSTLFVHGEDFQGVLLRFMGRQMGATSRGFSLMNLALKRRAEALSQAKGAQ